MTDKIIPIKRLDRWLTFMEIEAYEEEEARLYEQGYVLPPWRRAHQGCLCPICHKEFLEHPHHIPALWLHVLCNDELVKL